MSLREITFYKYQGTGNDFIIIDQLNGPFDLTINQISSLCSRRMGIGADGLMFLRSATDVDFEMKYYNADGNESTMCGNGGRCISDLYFRITGKSKSIFKAVDGLHESHKSEKGNIALQMADVNSIKNIGNDLIINSGSPHYIVEVANVDNVNVQKEGAKIRYNEYFRQKGINVNFMEFRDEGIVVEDETLSCGTGVTACALAANNLKGSQQLENISTVKTLGGLLQVKFHKTEKGYSDIWLIGPAELVFEGNHAPRHVGDDGRDEKGADSFGALGQ